MLQSHKAAPACLNDDPCLASLARTSFDPARLRFPGFFARHFESVRDSTNAGQVPAHFTAGVADETWVEVLRISRNDLVSHSHVTTCTAGQLWMWLAPGSGIWYNVGRSLRALGSHAFQRLWRSLPDRPCTIARKRGYDSIQLSAFDNHFSVELLDCRGAELPDANRSWHSACPPPHVPLVTGAIPPRRYAPALLAVNSSHMPRPCACVHEYDFLNCELSYASGTKEGASVASQDENGSRSTAMASEPRASTTVLHESMDRASRVPHTLYTDGIFAIGFDGGRRSFSTFSDVRSHLRDTICFTPPGATVPSIHASYVSSRVPNTFCAQPIRDTIACGSHSLLYLFDATARLWELSCQRTLFDACGHRPRECSGHPFDGPFVSSSQLPDCPTGSDQQISAGICDGEMSQFGWCKIGNRGQLEQAMLTFQRQCIRTPHNLSMGTNITSAPEDIAICQKKDPRGMSEEAQRRGTVQSGLLNTEVVFPCTDDALDEFASAMLAVAVINVVNQSPRDMRPSGWKASASAATTVRRQRAYDFWASLGRHLEQAQPLELWEHQLEGADGLVKATPPASYSREHGEMVPSDFAGMETPLAPSSGYHHLRDDHGTQWVRLGGATPGQYPGWLHEPEHSRRASTIWAERAHE